MRMHVKTPCSTVVVIFLQADTVKDSVGLGLVLFFYWASAQGQGRW